MKAKNLISAIAALSLVATLVPAAAFANEAEPSTTSTTEENICSADLLTKLGDRLTNFRGKFEDHMKMHEEKVDLRIDKHQTNQDGRMTRHWERQDKRTAQHPEVKPLVDTFRATVKPALDTKRATTSAELTKFRTTMEALEAARKAAIETALTNLKNGACATADTSDDAKGLQTFRDAVKTANDTFRQGMEAARPALKDALKANFGSFRDIVKNARTTFHEGLKSLKNSESTTSEESNT